MHALHNRSTRDLAHAPGSVNVRHRSSTATPSMRTGPTTAAAAAAASLPSLLPRDLPPLLLRRAGPFAAAEGEAPACASRYAWLMWRLGGSQTETGPHGSVGEVHATAE